MPSQWRRVAWVVGLTLGAVYLVRLANLTLEVRNAVRLQQQMERDLIKLEAEVEALGTAAVAAEQDAYVERVARERMGMARPGDTVLQPALIPSPTPPPAPPGPTAAPSAWDRLLGWLRGP